MSVVIENFVVSRHAVDRALDMGVKGEEIRQCLLHPDRVVRSRRYPARKNYRRGRVMCAVEGHRVVTVVWSSVDGWREDLEGNPEYNGRSYRGD